jgi:hypothetical protein
MEPQDNPDQEPPGADSQATDWTELNFYANAQVTQPDQPTYIPRARVPTGHTVTDVLSTVEADGRTYHGYDAGGEWNFNEIYRNSQIRLTDPRDRISATKRR